MKKVLIITSLIIFLYTLSSCTFGAVQISYLEEKDIEYPIYQDITPNEYLKKDVQGLKNAFPSKGTPKMLVIPINLNDEKATDKDLEELRIAFDGTEVQTGWESVRTYYEKASYGNLQIQMDVLQEWFTPQYEKEYYENYYDMTTQSYGDNLLLREALAAFNNKINYNDYDYDKDGYIDGIWLIYNCRIDFTGNSMWWAFQTTEESNILYDSIRAKFFAFAGLDFIHIKKTSYPNTDLHVDAHTYIHETGHLLGLDDYYNYNDTYDAEGLYGADMMDSNVGDHCSISKLLLGWVEPKVLTETTTVTLKNFSQTGEFLLVTKSFQTIYDEYFLIEFFNNSITNRHDKPFGSNCFGIRILHVNATLNSSGESNGGDYLSYFKYDNTDGDKQFVKQLRADSNVSNLITYNISSKSLFTTDSKVFGKEIYTNYLTHRNEKCFFQLEVLQMDRDSASVKISFL